MIGHNNEYACRFAAAMQKLKNLGLSGEIAVTGGVVMISTGNKFDAKTYRKAVKTACLRAGVKWTENRPKKSFYVFTIFV